MPSLDLALRTLIQEFHEIAHKRFALEESLKKEGTITRKKVKGLLYWYKQHAGKSVQEYIGPVTPENEKDVAASRENQKNRRSQIRQMILQERKRMSLLKRAGLPVLDPLTSSLVEKLSRWRLIYERGILAGSCAFAAYSGMLGHIFEKASLKTFDVDVVRDKENKKEDFFEENEFLQPGGLIAIRGKNFYSVPGLSHKSLPSSFVGPEGLRIDFLTPLRGPPKTIVPLPGFNQVGAQALHFLDFLIKDPVKSVLMGNRCAIPVTVPDPCRYAIHKLIVSVRRPVSENTKKLKDISQASQLITACSEENPDELKKIYHEAIRRGKGWKTALSNSLKHLAPDVRILLCS